MKAIVLYNQNTGKLEIIGHDLDDEQATKTVNDYSASGKEAYIIDQLRPHGGRADRCAKCKMAGEKLFSGPLAKDREEPPEPEVSPLSIGAGSISLNVTQESSLIEKIKPFRSRLITILVAILILIGIIGLIYLVGKIPRKESIAQRINPSSSPIPTSTPIPITPYKSPTPTLMSTSTVTPTPTFTRTPTVTRTETVLPPSPTRGCIPTLEITLNDVGKVLCVTGTVIRLYIQDDLLYIVFSDERGKFYMYANDPTRTDITTGMCIQYTGEVRKIGNSPIMLLDVNDKVSPCP